MRRTIGLLVLVLLLAACGGAGSGPAGGGPKPAEFDHPGCTFDGAGTKFGP